MSETIALRVAENGGTVPLVAEQARVIEAVSPTVDLERVEGGVAVTVHDLRGTQTETVLDGAKGDPGDPGRPGSPGQPGVSPTASVTQTATGATVTVTDASGTTTANLTNGQDGEPGQDGVSPTITVTDITGGHRVTITDATGAHSFDVMDGDSADAPVQDVQVNGVSVLDAQGVANVPVATSSRLGAVRQGVGLNINQGGELYIPHATDAQMQAGTAAYNAVNIGQQHLAAFYGLAKAAGDTTQSASSNPVGTYTDEAKTAIRTMLGAGEGDVKDVQVNGVSVLQDGVANVPVASSSYVGVVKASALYGIAVSNGLLQLQTASINNCKQQTGSTGYQNLTVFNQHAAAFYGLAKAAGDSTQSASSNAVGTYTESAKSAIHTMLNGPVTVSGSTPTITALPGIRYVCGEVSTLDITLPASGIVDVVFESGSTPTVLTVTTPTGMTMKWANGFDPTSLEANTTYEVNIADGLGVAAAWT